MDDNLSIKSSDSVNTSGEYEIVPELNDDMTDNCVNNVQTLKLNSMDEPISTGGQPAKSPTLNIANNGDILDLEKHLNELIYELDDSSNDSIKDIPKCKPTTSTTSTPKLSNTIDSMPSTSIESTTTADTTIKASPINETTNITTTAIATEQIITTTPTIIDKNQVPPLPQIINKIGQSVFYDCLDLSPMAEKQDYMKPERNSSDTEEEMSDIDQDCTIFSGVTYFGAVSINAPKSEIEIQRNITELNGITDTNATGLKVSISIPTCTEGLVVLYDASTNAVISHYEINRIIFYARGPAGSVDQACFAFTWSHGDTQESAVFRCHVFKCHIPEAVQQVSSCFAKAFQRAPPSLTGSITSATDNNIMLASITSDTIGNVLSSAEYEFIVSLEIRERVTKNQYSAVSRDRGSFKLRCNTDKEVYIIVRQTQSNKFPILHIDRCFGVLLSPGKLVRQTDMQLLEMVSMGYQKIEAGQQQTLPFQRNPQVLQQQQQPQQSQPTQSQQQSQQQHQLYSAPITPYLIIAEWRANDKNFEQLNSEISKMFITIAVNLVITGIQEPVRFVIETPVTIQSQSEIRIMDHIFTGSGKKQLLQRYYLQLKERDEGGWKVHSIDPCEEIIETPSNYQNQATSILKSFGINSITRMVRSTSTISMENDESPTDYSSDGDEPLLSGTGEVTKDCSQDTLDEWDPILQEWEQDKRPKNLSALVRLGVPEALRGRIWQKLANVEHKTEITDKYRVLLAKDTKCEEIIQRDIHRTFPAHKFFRETGGSGQDALFKVSKAYAVYDSEVGYCQGLSFVAASLLLHMPEEESFSVLVALMYEYGLRDLYKDGFVNLHLRLYQLQRLMKDQIPKLYEHFERIGIETHMFASQWFLTLFTARFPLYFVFHILDVFLLDGIPILFQVAITLLSVCETDLRQLDFEGILKYFRVQLPKKCRSAGQARKLMKMACEKKVKKLKQYEFEFQTNKELAEKEELKMQHFKLQFEEERKKLDAEVQELKTKLNIAIEKNEMDNKKNIGIIFDYKKIIQRHEEQITNFNEMLSNVTKITSQCKTCSESLQQNSPLHRYNESANSEHLLVDAPLGPLDPYNEALHRIRELELQLAETKLAQVEAECLNQDLNHQLNATLTGGISSSNRNSWQPWLSKAMYSIQEKVGNRRETLATFQSYASPTPAATTATSNQTITNATKTTSLQSLTDNILNNDRQNKSPQIRHKERIASRNSRSSLDYTKTDHNILNDTLSLK